MSEEIKKGLLGIVVDETTVSHVVPELSALTYRGYKVQAVSYTHLTLPTILLV